MPTLTHIFNDIEYTIEYTYYHGDPEDYEVTQIWETDGNIVPIELFDQVLLSCDMITKIREDKAGYEDGRDRIGGKDR